MKIPAAKVVFPQEDQEDILNKIQDCLSTGQLTLGKYGEAFEEAFAHHIGTSYAIGVNSGTSAIEIVLRIMGVVGKEVIVPTNTFFATVAAVLHAGAKPRFVDMDPETFGIDVESLKHNITQETVGVIAVHIAGIVSHRMPEIQEICAKNKLFLVEDAAHAHGSMLNGQKAGTFGIAAAFSFYPTKVMTCAEGGMIATSSEVIREQALAYRDQGKVDINTNVHDKLGYNWRLSEVHAILGLSQLKRLDDFIAARRRIARLYDEHLPAVRGVHPLPLAQGCKSNYYKYIAVLSPGIDRAAVRREMRNRFGISLSGEVYELPCHLQPFFKGTYCEGDFPVAEDLCRRHICLPLYPTMTEEEAQYVLTSLEQVLGSL
jgi:dTDP-4-amino-4,6-dideoxygalactose transaminase